MNIARQQQEKKLEKNTQQNMKRKVGFVAKKKEKKVEQISCFRKASRMLIVSVCL
jgi:hypothetical protein